MANVTTAVLPKLLAQGLLALRQTVVLPRIVNRGYEVLAGEKGSVINVPIPSAITAVDVTPANTPPVTADVAPTSVDIKLDQWKEAPFYLTDKDQLECMNGVIPMQASEAIKALANAVETYLWGLFETNVYGYVGTAGTTPFAADLKVFTNARKTLNKQLCPTDARFSIIDPDAEDNALNLRAFQDASFRGDTAGIVEGQIGKKLGALWAMSQLVKTHTTGATTAGVIAVDLVAGYAVGVKTIHMDGFATKASPGDIFTLAGDTQTYVVKSATDLAGTDSDVTFEPGLKVAVADDVVVTFKASHVMNANIHRDCLAFATRPLESTGEGLGHFLSAVDPVSGLALRLEITREHKRTRYSYDMLFGGGCPRPEFGCKMAG